QRATHQAVLHNVAVDVDVGIRVAGVVDVIRVRGDRVVVDGEAAGVVGVVGAGGAAAGAAEQGDGVAAVVVLLVHEVLDLPVEGHGVVVQGQALVGVVEGVHGQRQLLLVVHAL